VGSGRSQRISSSVSKGRKRVQLSRILEDEISNAPNITLKESEININNSQEISENKAQNSKRIKSGSPGHPNNYRETEQFEKHQNDLPPYPKSYSSHPINEMHMQVQGKYT
jgi:hypothetical protein